LLECWLIILEFKHGVGWLNGCRISGSQFYRKVFGVPDNDKSILEMRNFAEG
jgi:hypothetical protein